MAERERYRIGQWLFNVEEGSLAGPDETRPLEHRAARTLALLCRRRGDTVPRSDILDEVWNGRAVSANSVAVVIGDLRRALDDQTGSPLHIVTVARRGYRLTPEAASASQGGRPRHRVGLVALAVGLVLCIASVIILGQSDPVWTVSAEAVRNETGLDTYDPLARALDEVVTNRLSHFESASILLPAAAPPDASPARRPVIVKARLIIWAGNPELSLTAIDGRSGTVLWSAMAPGPADRLGASTAALLDGLDRRLASLEGWSLRRILAFL